MSGVTFSPGESLVMWIHLAIQQGLAVEKTDRIELGPEYLETIGHHQAGDVVSLDVGCEGAWLANANVYRSGERLIFELYDKLLFVLPIERGQFAESRYLALSQHESPLAPPLEIKEWDKQPRIPQCLGRPFFFLTGSLH